MVLASSHGRACVGRLLLYGEELAFAKDWPKNPLEILNEELLTFQWWNPGEVGEQPKCKRGNVLVGMPTPSGPEGLQELSPYSGLSMSSGWTFSIGDYSKAELRKGYRLKTQDAIFQWNEWWTRSHRNWW